MYASGNAIWRVLMKNGPYELVVAPSGYPGKKYRGRYCYKHHLVWWRHTGEVPGPGELIHHRNENKRDNRFRNLKKEGWVDHTKHHLAQRTKAATIRLICLYCGNSFGLLRNMANKRIKQQIKIRGKFVGLFCSRSCQISDQQRRKRS